MMIQITILLVLGISLVIFLIIFQKSGKAVSLQRIESYFPDPSAILRVEPTANFFGLKSRGSSQIRGNGVLVLSIEELWFSRFVPRLDISISLNQIQEVCLVRSHLGKRVFGSKLLYVEFQTDEGINAVAWFVAEPEEWQSAIANAIR
jgi:hypothetical protein